MNNSYSFYETCQDKKSDSTFSKICWILGETKYPSHFHRKIEITYVLKGIVKSTINNTKFIGEPDDIIFCPPFYPHDYHTSPNAERIVFVPHPSYTLDFEFETKGKTFSPLILSDKVYNRTEILPVLKQIIENDKRKKTQMVIKGLVNVLLGKILERYTPRKLSDKSINQFLTFTQVLVFIEEHAAEKLTLDRLSRHFGYDKFHFSKKFNKYTGFNLRNYINNLRINNFIFEYRKAKKPNVAEIALESGFSSMPSFYRAFHGVTGKTPSEYFH